ncbi:U4/U6 small nuclear ribonucleoprotein Prp31 [Geranomyces michiganensis]|nr:U4/U6 small nuclear ribonucleoprotein Prp31 [Geranomyces michiganensis]
MDEDLLLDLEDLGGDDDFDDLQDVKQEEESGTGTADNSLGGGFMDGVEYAPPKGELDELHSTARLTSSKLYKDVLERIAQFSGKDRKPGENFGPVEEDPEYRLIVSSNNLTAEIDNEILIVYKFIRDHYAPRFVELESLVVHPLDYARIVSVVGNDMDVAAVDARIKAFLPTPIVMSVTIAVSQNKGRPLSDAELATVMDSCAMILELDASKRKIQEYVESRMSFIAPNLSILLGSNLAAKLMGVAGGLKSLSKIPACDIIVLGKAAKMNMGLSSASEHKHEGLVYQSDMIATIPQEFKRKAARVLSAKVCLVARMDHNRSSTDGAHGLKLREEVQAKINDSQKPPPGKSIKALPIPDEGPKKRRGGKKFRAEKDRTKQSELSKAANRMAFGVAEDEIGYESGSTRGMGLVGAETGKVRVAQADTRQKVNMAKKHQKNWGSQSGAMSGLASSVAFTPVKGIELENPEAAAMRAQASAGKYFSGATFFKRPADPDANGDGRPSKSAKTAP